MAQHTLDYKNGPPTYSEYLKRHNQKFPTQPIISENQFLAISQKNCQYCGKSGPNGIDRVDNRVGYSAENCVPCCKHCNYVKGDFSSDMFEQWAERFVAHQIPAFASKSDGVKAAIMTFLQQVDGTAIK